MRSLHPSVRERWLKCTAPKIRLLLGSGARADAHFRRTALSGVPGVYGSGAVETLVGPKDFTSCELDVRPGGAVRIDMRGAGGTVYPTTGVYHEIVVPERLVFTSAALDENGKPLFEVLNTLTFSEHGGKTEDDAGDCYEGDRWGCPIRGGYGRGLETIARAPCRRGGTVSRRTGLSFSGPGGDRS